MPYSPLWFPLDYSSLFFFHVNVQCMDQGYNKVVNKISLKKIKLRERKKEKTNKRQKKMRKNISATVYNYKK